MPLYEYQCKKCHHRFEKIQKFSDPHVKKCPDCGGPVEQVISAPAVPFQSSGWDVSDHARKPPGASAEATAGPSPHGESSSEEKADKPKGQAGENQTPKKTREKCI